MRSHLTKDFIKLFYSLPDRIKLLAKQKYRQWKENSQHPSLNFKELISGSNIYSVRIGLGWRAIGVRNDDNIIWFWIGSHSDYDQLIKKIRKINT